MSGPLKGSLSAVHLGAGIVVGALRLGSSLLGGISAVVEGIAHLGGEDLRDRPAEAAIPTPEGFRPGREGAPVAPEGFYAGTGGDSSPGVEDVLAPPRSAAGRGELAASPGPSARVPIAAERVDEEAVLVAEFADPGAENGAGAQVHVEEPWKGYGSLRAADIVDRLVAEPDGVVSLVLLYEGAHRGRTTIISASERQLRRRA